MKNKEIILLTRALSYYTIFSMNVDCDVAYTTMQNEKGVDQSCVLVTCRRCYHQTHSWGQEYRSVRRCLTLLRLDCPREEANFYQV